MGVVFAGILASCVHVLLHWNVYILFTVGVVFAGKLKLSYTRKCIFSLLCMDRSTRASEHVTVQISLPVRLPGWQVFIIV